MDLGESPFYIQKEAESLDSASHREQTFLLCHFWQMVSIYLEEPHD